MDPTQRYSFQIAAATSKGVGTSSKPLHIDALKGCKSFKIRPNRSDRVNKKFSNQIIGNSFLNRNWSPGPQFRLIGLLDLDFKFLAFDFRPEHYFVIIIFLNQWSNSRSR